MALKKRTRPPKAPAGTTGKSKQQSTPTIMLGLVLAAAAAIFAGLFITGAAKNAQVMVAKSGIAPYQNIKPDMLEPKTVPQKSVTEQDLTPQEFEAYKGKAFVSRIDILAGQRVDQRSLAPDDSLSVVKGDEVLVGVTTTLAGTAAGAIGAGSVVDVLGVDPSGSADTSSEPVAEDVKVLGVGTGVAASEGVRAKGQKAPEAKGSDQGQITVLLAVARSDAQQIVNTPRVSLALNPRLRFDINGDLCELGACRAADEKTTTPVDLGGQSNEPEQDAGKGEGGG